jgi:hypothetical protein
VDIEKSWVLLANDAESFPILLEIWCRLASPDIGYESYHQVMAGKRTRNQHDQPASFGIKQGPQIHTGGNRLLHQVDRSNPDEECDF